MDEFRRGSLTFDVLDKGPSDGPPVVFLHGFPQFNTSWSAVIDRVSARGYDCVAPNQRGYSPRARPQGKANYLSAEIARDAVALIDTLGVPKVHLVGHDWGGSIAWTLAGMAPDRLASLTVLSTPHPLAYFAALKTPEQLKAAWYALVFQIPKLPEFLMSRNGGQGLGWFIGDYLGQSPAGVVRDVRQMKESGALTAAINWYRAIPLNKKSAPAEPNADPRVKVPLLYVWSDADRALREQAARDTARFVDAEYRFEIVPGATHWLPDECPDLIADLVLDWIAAHPI